MCDNYRHYHDAGTGIRRLGKEIMEDEILRESPFSSHLPTSIGIIFKDSFFEPAYIKEKKSSLLALVANVLSTTWNALRRAHAARDISPADR